MFVFSTVVPVYYSSTEVVRFQYNVFSVVKNLLVFVQCRLCNNFERRESACLVERRGVCVQWRERVRRKAGADTIVMQQRAAWGDEVWRGGV